MWLSSMLNLLTNWFNRVDNKNALKSANHKSESSVKLTMLCFFFHRELVYSDKEYREMQRNALKMREKMAAQKSPH